MTRAMDLGQDQVLVELDLEDWARMGAALQTIGKNRTLLKKY